MLMELMDGYTHPVLNEGDFIWLARDYMGDEAADYFSPHYANALLKQPSTKKAVLNRDC